MLVKYVGQVVPANVFVSVQSMENICAISICSK